MSEVFVISFNVKGAESPLGIYSSQDTLQRDLAIYQTFYGVSQISVHSIMMDDPPKVVYHCILDAKSGEIDHEFTFCLSPFDDPYDEDGVVLTLHSMHPNWIHRYISGFSFESYEDARFKANSARKDILKDLKKAGRVMTELDFDAPWYLTEIV